jgi:hypothetical protein
VDVHSAHVPTERYLRSVILCVCVCVRVCVQTVTETPATFLRTLYVRERTLAAQKLLALRCVCALHEHELSQGNLE